MIPNVTSRKKWNAVAKTIAPCLMGTCPAKFKKPYLQKPNIDRQYQMANETERILLDDV